MKKLYMKLISMVLVLILSISVLAASSYAWMVLSSSPAITGIQVAIGGGNTVLIAPNIQEMAADGTVFHYPGRFSDKMNFGYDSAYDYLKEIGNLNPVSTVNGVDWILPTYYSGSDTQVQQGLIPSGTLKDVADFMVDSELEYANLSAQETERIEKGHYVYLDFWVVSPANDYKLRVSTGVNEENGGSFVIDLLQPQVSALGYSLKNPEGSPASAMRVGFLANDLMVTDESMARYQQSQHFDNRFSLLKGFYQEPNTGTAYLDANRFTIYEPNGDYHPTNSDIDGYYVETKPLGLENGKISEMNLRERYEILTVQGKSSWVVPEGSTVTAIEQQFQTALHSGKWGDLSADEMSDRFYGGFLQGQLASYVQKGGFVQKTSNLYAQLASGNASLSDANVGATDDVYIIELERNVPQRIRMFIWLEGQDVDCTEQICSSRFMVNIELACGDE